VLIGRAGTLDRAYPDLLADLRQAVSKLNRPGKPKGQPRPRRTGSSSGHPRSGSDGKQTDG
jgi:hypothetical protein